MAFTGSMREAIHAGKNPATAPTTDEITSPSATLPRVSTIVKSVTALTTVTPAKIRSSPIIPPTTDNSTASKTYWKRIK